ncbi:MAG: dihydrofolate reductase, partial [Notoacmeibacter sp.]
MVAAVADNGVIGANGGLPFKLSTDLKRFKAVTLGKPVIMGRKTFESIGKPLPGRINIVISRNPDFEAEGVISARSLDEAIRIGVA